MKPLVWGNEAVDPVQIAKQKKSRVAKQLISSILMVAALVVIAVSALIQNWLAFWAAAFVTASIVILWIVIGVVGRFYDYLINDR